MTVDGPSKVQLECREVPEGQEFTYTPTLPGDYLIMIKFGGNIHIPGSPFRARITGTQLYIPEHLLVQHLRINYSEAQASFPGASDELGE